MMSHRRWSTRKQRRHIITHQVDLKTQVHFIQIQRPDLIHSYPEMTHLRSSHHVYHLRDSNRQEFFKTVKNASAMVLPEDHVLPVGHVAWSEIVQGHQIGRYDRCYLLVAITMNFTDYHPRPMSHQ